VIGTPNHIGFGFLSLDRWPGYKIIYTNHIGLQAPNFTLQLQILEIYWNLKTVLEILEISWNLIGSPGNFCVRCRRSTALVSIGYQIAYLRNWPPYFIFATAPCCMKCISYFWLELIITLVIDSVHYIGGRSKANMSWIFLKIPPGNLLD